MRRSVRDAIVGFTVIGGIIGFASTALWLRGVRLGSSYWSLTARFDDAAGLPHRRNELSGTSNWSPNEPLGAKGLLMQIR